MKVASVIALLVVAGCTPPSRLVRPVEHPNYGDDPLRLVLTDPSDSRPVAVSAGSATVWIGRDGGGTGHPAYVLASSGEPLISVENPFAFKILMDGQVVPFQPGPGYSQTLDLRNGEVETRWSGQDFSVTTVCRSLERGPSVELSVEVRSTQPIQIEWPKSRPPEFAHVTMTSSGSRFTRTVTFNGGRLSPDHATIEIDGPIEDRQLVNSMVHFVCGGAGDGLGPFGTTEPRYDGRVFWDQDAWVFPVAALLAPQRAQAIVEFRSGPRLSAAKAAALAEYPTLKGGARYPWESDEQGRESARPDNRDEIHVSGAVARMFDLAADLELVDPRTADEVVAGTATYYEARSKRINGYDLGLFQVRSPDEYQMADNDLYTNASAEWCLSRSRPMESWLGRFRRPRDAKTFLTYDGDPLLGYQQAAALLALWPLQDPICEKEAQAMLERFVGKATPNGPAMTASVESLLLARYGDPERAYTEWKAGLRRATGRPFLMFSESPKKAQAYFVTGAAGFLDSVLYGFLGLRFDPFEPQAVLWKTKLKRGWLSCTPHLPKTWKSVAVKGMALGGERYDVVATRSGVTVTPVGSAPRK